MNEQVVACPQCAARLKLNRPLAEIRCPRCQTVFPTGQSPSPAGGAAPPPRAAAPVARTAPSQPKPAAPRPRLSAAPNTWELDDDELEWLDDDDDVSGPVRGRKKKAGKPIGAILIFSGLGVIFFITCFAAISIWMSRPAEKRLADRPAAEQAPAPPPQPGPAVEPFRIAPPVTFTPPATAPGNAGAAPQAAPLNAAPQSPFVESRPPGSAASPPNSTSASPFKPVDEPNPGVTEPSDTPGERIRRNGEAQMAEHYRQFEDRFFRDIPEEKRWRFVFQDIELRNRSAVQTEIRSAAGGARVLPRPAGNQFTLIVGPLESPPPFLAGLQESRVINVNAATREVVLGPKD